jgi:tRNA G37 N-methylase Trm5
MGRISGQRAVIISLPSEHKDQFDALCRYVEQHGHIRRTFSFTHSISAHMPVSEIEMLRGEFADAHIELDEPGQLEQDS